MKKTQKDGFCLIEVGYSQIDALNTHRFQQDLEKHLTTCKLILLNFSEVRFIDSSGLGVLLGLYRDLSQRGGQLVVCSMNSAVSTLFDMVKLSQIIPCFETREEGESYLRGE